MIYKAIICILGSLFLVFFINSCGVVKHSEGNSSALLCQEFESQSPGAIVLTIDGSNVDIDWTSDLSFESNATLSVSLAGTTNLSASEKPSSFTGLNDGVWTAMVVYSKEGCNDVSSTREFTIDTSVDCTTWDSSTVASSITTTPSVGAVSVSWSGGTISGQDSYSVTVSGTADKTMSNSNPANFTSMSPGDYTATILYSKSGCTDKTQTSAAFTIPTSFSNDVVPLLSSCLSCHGSSGNFTVSYSELTSETTMVCGSPEFRVIANDAINSAFYKKITGSTCGSQMGTGGKGSLSSSDIEVIKTWIDEGALDN